MICFVNAAGANADISMVAVRKIIDLYPLYDKFLMESKGIKRK